MQPLSKPQKILEKILFLFKNIEALKLQLRLDQPNELYLTCKSVGAVGTRFKHGVAKWPASIYVRPLTPYKHFYYLS